MFKRIKNLFRKKPEKILVLGSHSFDKITAKEIGEKLGVSVIYTPNVEDVKIIGGDNQVSLGDGKAEFIGPGTEEEWIEQQRKDEGTDKWYKRIGL